MTVHYKIFNLFPHSFVSGTFFQLTCNHACMHIWKSFYKFNLKRPCYAGTLLVSRSLSICLCFPPFVHPISLVWSIIIPSPLDPKWLILHPLLEPLGKGCAVILNHVSRSKVTCTVYQRFWLAN